MIPFVGNKM